MQRLEDSRGVAMVAVIILAVAMTILVSMFVFWIGEESKSSVKGVKSTKAFHLAEAALDRGRWKLQASNTFWTQTGEDWWPSKSGVTVAPHLLSDFEDAIGKALKQAKHLAEKDSEAA